MNKKSWIETEVTTPHHATEQDCLALWQEMLDKCNGVSMIALDHIQLCGLLHLDAVKVQELIDSNQLIASEHKGNWTFSVRCLRRIVAEQEAEKTKNSHLTN